MPRPIAKDYDDKRQAILRSAAQVFAREGIARASMAQVAKASGISKANIYHYYDSKQALLFDMLDKYLSALRDRICGLDLSGMAAQDKLRAVLAETLLSYEGMDAEHKIQTEGIALLPAAQQDVLKGYQRDMVILMEIVLKDAAPEVFDGDRAKLRAAAMSVFGMLNWFYMWNRAADAEARRAYADLVARLTMGGVPAL